MKAIVYTQYGPPSVLKVKEIKKPFPKENEVRISVHAATVNRTDCAMLRGEPFIMRFFTGLLKPTRKILGTEFAGEIDAVGKDANSFKVGDRVFGFDDSGLSSHAQYITLSTAQAFTTIPGNITYAQAAASTEGAHYAYNFINKIRIESGQNVLVNGATGAIGSAAVQLLKYFGANVTAVCNTKNAALMRSLGADKIIDYTREDFTRDKQEYDFVFDAVGKSSFNKCKPLLKPGGAYISSALGWMAQNIFLALITAIVSKLPGGHKAKKVIFPLPTDIKASILLIKKLMAEGKFKAVIDRKYPLEQIADAYTYVEKGEKTGNVVITLENNNSS